MSLKIGPVSKIALMYGRHWIIPRDITEAKHSLVLREEIMGDVLRCIAGIGDVYVLDEHLKQVAFEAQHPL